MSSETRPSSSRGGEDGRAPLLDSSRAELVAAMATLVHRYTDRSQVIIGFRDMDGDDEQVAVAVELGDDPSFATVVERVLAAQRDGARHPGLNGYDVLLTTQGPRLLDPGSGPPAELLDGHLRTLRAAAATDAGRGIDTLPILTDDERARLLFEWNRTEAPYPSRCVDELFAEQARRAPARIAVQAGDTKLTYGELDAASDRLAGYLRARGVGPGVLVGVCLSRCTDMLVGLLGILKAGGAYVPIDPSYPADRQAFMLSDSEAPVLVTQEGLVASLPPGEHRLVCLDRDSAQIATAPAEPPEGDRDPEQLAYVIYTSGSTGQPKGVEIPHRALVNLLSSMAHRPGLAPSDVLVAVTTLSFDIAALELYLPLLTGARVVIASSETTADPRALWELLDRSDATVMQATPTTWRLLLDAGWPGRPGLKALCGGEALSSGLARRLLAASLELWNMYGPTETTIWSACARIELADDPVTIGRPIANTTLYILDRHLQPVPVGVAGELWIGGEGVARGYHRRSDLTATRFVGDPFARGVGKRIYRTGDMARYRTDGRVEFLGRLDHQVKVRGHRIELGEIESVLACHPGVRDAVVVARRADGDGAELAAYVLASGPPVAAHALREFAAGTLPAYMVPSTVTHLEAFPLTPNGKVDHQALPEPSRGRASEHRRVSPGTELEQRLLAIWERELNIGPIGVTDDFFELGVTSIAAATLFAAIERELGSDLPLGAIFRARSIRALAELLESGPERSRWTSLVAIQPLGSQPPIFCVHGGAGTILHLQSLAAHLGPDQPFYGLQSRGLYGGAAPLRTVPEMAAHYLAEMREVHPGGAWRLAGYCFGTLVAFEMAQRLTDEGEEVELLAMFNGPSPSWIRTWGWFGNQPGWRARHALPPRPTEAQRRARRLRRLPRRAASRLARVPRLITEPRRIAGGVAWHTRRPTTRVRLALGLPIPERHREDFFFELHSRAERAYHPSPFDGEILVFYGEGLYEDPTLGWEGLARGGIRSLAVPGEHTGNRRMMREPAVAFVAERLRAHLARQA